LGVPLLERGPARRNVLLPGDLQPLPQAPALLDAQVLVSVIHHGPEPAGGRYIPESLRLDPILKRFPERPLLVRSVSFEKAGTAFAEFGAQEAREFAGVLGDGADPQDETVPSDVLADGCIQLAPRNEESLLESFLFPYLLEVENEIMNVFSRHPQPLRVGRQPALCFEPLHFNNSWARPKDATASRASARKHREFKLNSRSKSQTIYLRGWHAFTPEACARGRRMRIP
jgi:hypothetical protein